MRQGDLIGDENVGVLLRNHSAAKHGIDLLFGLPPAPWAKIGGADDPVTPKITIFMPDKEGGEILRARIIISVAPAANCSENPEVEAERLGQYIMGAGAEIARAYRELARFYLWREDIFRKMQDLRRAFPNAKTGEFWLEFGKFEEQFFNLYEFMGDTAGEEE